ncbi:hypothetical protein CK203_113303 [Vitis vinifera]|uniref:DUF4218 domain-containing protein n=1 Tax=Vitis vinifera TaxID=29760 RepID=A0A438FGJ5_VITVI|nr:hypothetical protein CK203_113303 [Vitis vinifera]
MLPLNNEMSLSMYEAKKTFSTLGMEYQKIHACPNDCILYRNQYKDVIACPTCGKSRWKINSEGEKIKKGVPAKVLWYFPPIPRFKRMFQSSETAKHLMWHAKDKECDGPRQPGKNIDVYLSPLVDDLKTLWEKGVETYDAHLREVFTLKAILLWTINDFPAYGNLAGCTVKGYYACPICGEGTYSKRLKHGKTKDGLNARLDLVEMGLRNLVSLEELKLFGLKSHDYHALMQQLLPVALRSVLPKHVRLCGPVYFRWMYPFERYMKVLKGYVRNHNRPEGCIVECYLAEEAVEFCTEYLSGTHAIGIPKSNNYDNKFGRPITGGRSTNIDHKSWLQAHHYVLENTIIVQPYIEEHMNWLKSQYPRQSKRQIWLQEEHMRCFMYWLKGKVEEAIHNGQDISNTLRWLAHGPTHQVVKYLGYIINGCRYHTKERDMTCVTQNSGVSILVGTMQIASSKDKNLVFGELCFYGVINEIWDLDYNMFRIPIFKCDWVDNKNASQAKKVFYVEDQLDPKWSIVLSIPPKDFNNMEGLDDFTDNCMEHHPFISSMPKVESFDVMDESDAIYMRED